MGMRRNSACRHLIPIGLLLLKHKEIDEYDVAGRLGISPTYAYQLMRMFACHPIVLKHFKKRGLRVVFDSGSLRVESMETLSGRVRRAFNRLFRRLKTHEEG